MTPLRDALMTANTYDALDYLRKMDLKERQQQMVDRVRSRLRHDPRLRIAFVVNDRAKSNATPLLDRMQVEGWVTRVYLCLSDVSRTTGGERGAAYLEQRRFFETIDPGMGGLYDVGTDLEAPIEQVTENVVLYQQP